MTPEEIARWRKEPSHVYANYPQVAVGRMLALIAEVERLSARLESVERERDEWRDVSVGPAYATLLTENLQKAEAALADLRAKVEALADKWNATPDYTPSDYDQGRVDQRHDMTTEIYVTLLDGA